MSKKLLRLFRRKPKVVDYWDCSHLHLTELPREVLEHRHTLKSLYMSTNSVRDFPRAILLLEGLTELDLSENDLLFLPPSISKLRCLTTLNLGKNSINNIPDSIGDLQDLEVLDLSCNPVGTICDGMLELRQLRVLILNDAQVEELPPNFGKLSRLEVLELRENMLQALPASLSHLTLLTKLDLGNNEFVTMPTVIGALESLSELWFDTNTISVVPEEIGNLHNLRFLELSENHIMILPETIGLLANLTDLYLNDNLLTFLPDTLGDLHNLVYVRLDNNRLGSLPETLDGLVNAVEFNVAHNHLTDIPPTVGGMTSLNNLVLDDNILRDIPPEIGNCTSLVLLSFRNNQIFELPSELSSLTRLSILNLAGNQLQHLPYSFTTLTNISAIWIAENQSRPILDLQMKIGDDGERYLTCFLLPQQGREKPYSDVTSPLDAVADEDYEDRMLHRKASQVNFDPKVTDRKSNLTRDPTPFPKELHNKAMQWRAAREKGGAHGRDGQSSPSAVPMDEIALRRPVNRRLQNRYSLLKALSDPLIEENLMPSSGVEGHHHSQTPPHVTMSPPPPPILEQEERVSTATPTSSSGGKITPTTPTNKTPVATSPDFLQVSPAGKSGSAGSEVESIPLPPFYSPEGSCIQSVQSGPYLDPPVEFSSQNVPPPMNDRPPTTSPTTTKPHPPINGGVRYQPGSQSASPDQPAERDADRESEPITADHAAFLANTNGNNSNPMRRRPMPVLVENGASAAASRHPVSSPNSRGLQREDKKFPSHSSILTHSDNAGTRSSMESGFDADSELENTTAWYLSPDSSPKPDSKVPRPRLGPQVAVGSPNSGGQGRNISRPPVVVTSSSRRNGNGSNDPLAHYQQYSGTASDMQSVGGSSQKSRESSISDYDRLHSQEKTRQQHTVVVHDYENLRDSRRSSVPGEMGLLEDADPFYSEILPLHTASKSFDNAAILSERLYGEEMPPNVVRFTSPPPSAIPKSMRGHVVLFNGHSPTPGAPLSPGTLTSAAAAAGYHLPSSRTSGGAPAGVVLTSYRDNGASGATEGMRYYSRSRSQPEDFVGVAGASAATPSPLIPHSNSQPHYSSVHHTSQHHHHHQHHRKDGRHSSRSSGHRRYMEHSTFKSSYPGHHKSSQKSHRNGSKSHSSGGGRNSSGGHRSSHFPTVARVVENQPYVSEGSQDSGSGRGTQETTPNLAQRQVWANGNDSGFNSMNREKPHPLVGGNSHHYSHSGTCFEVTLTKDPTLGLGITGGTDADNTVKPGDTGFHVYKVIEGLPAQRCCKIAIGDKLLQVDGIEVTSLTTQEVLTLLTGPEETVTLLLYREPSVTLL